MGKKTHNSSACTHIKIVALIKKCLDPFYLSPFTHSVRFYIKNVQDNIGGMTIQKKRIEMRRELKWVQRVHFIVGIWSRQAVWTLPHVLWRIKSAHKRKMCKICQHHHTLSRSRPLLIYWATCLHWKFNEFLYLDSHSLLSLSAHVKCGAAKKRLVAFHVHVHVHDIFRMMSVPKLRILFLSSSLMD